MDTASPLELARCALSRLKARVADLDCVCGVGISRHGGEYILKVNVTRQLAGTECVPPSIDGVPIVVQLIARVRKQ